MDIYKFGGASVKDALSFHSIPHIIRQSGKHDLVIVISAMGKTTNALERLTRAFFNCKKETAPEFDQIRHYHFSVIGELFPDASHPVHHEVTRLFDEMLGIITGVPGENFDFEYDRIVSYGEMLSSKILSHYLNDSGITNSWFDITRVLITNDDFRHADVIWPETLNNIHKLLIPAMHQNGMIVTQGFIGRSGTGQVVTLGREGSDYSAAILAFCLEAESVTIWKDVEGVLNADPRYFSQTQVIEQLSYNDAVELAYYGASVIHPKTIKPLQNKKIPLFVRSFANPLKKGSVITEALVKLPLPVFIYKFDQVLVSIYPGDFSFIGEENLRDIFSMFAARKTTINLMQNTAISFSLVVDNEPDKLSGLINDLQQQFKVRYNLGLELITIRNFDQKTIDQIISGKEILLEQKTRFTAQIVVRNRTHR